MARQGPQAKAPMRALLQHNSSSRTTSHCQRALDKGERLCHVGTPEQMLQMPSFTVHAIARTPTRQGAYCLRGPHANPINFIVFEWRRTRLSDAYRRGRWVRREVGRHRRAVCPATRQRALSMPVVDIPIGIQNLGRATSGGQCHAVVRCSVRCHATGAVQRSALPCTGLSRTCLLYTSPSPRD